LFKKKGEEFVGRFHERFPITVRNPITNSRIIGEVEFYKIANFRIEPLSDKNMNDMQENEPPQTSDNI